MSVIMSKAGNDKYRDEYDRIFTTTEKMGKELESIRGETITIKPKEVPDERV